MITIEDKNVAIISDIHLGIHGDSPVWHKIALDYARWLKDELNKHNVNIIFILGDLFNNREEVGVKTLSATEEFFNILKEFKIKIMLGNHDCYFKDVTDITSASLLRGWNNIEIIDKMESVKVKGKVLTFCPWGTDINSIPSSDYVFGHFAINTFHENTVKLCEHGVNSEELLAKSPLIFSGHFHIRSEREYSQGKIIYNGCPFQMNFGDTETKKGVYLLNLVDGNYEFIENTVSPQYFKIKLSTLLDPLTMKEAAQKIKNNFIKIVTDADIEYRPFTAVMEKLMLLKPLDLTNDFRDIQNASMPLNQAFISLDIKNMLVEYVDGIDTNLDKGLLQKETQLIYEKASNNLKMSSVA